MHSKSTSQLAELSEIPCYDAKGNRCLIQSYSRSIFSSRLCSTSPEHGFLGKRERNMLFDKSHNVTPVTLHRINVFGITIHQTKKQCLLKTYCVYCVNWTYNQDFLLFSCPVSIAWKLWEKLWKELYNNEDSLLLHSPSFWPRRVLILTKSEICSS